MKRLLLFLALLFAAFSSTAQMTDANMGIIGGVNFSNITGPTNAYRPAITGNVGLLSYVRVGTLSAETNILYSWQGALLNNEQKTPLDLQYIKVAAMARFTFTSPFEACVLHGAAGVSCNFLTSSKMDGVKVGGLNKFDLSIPVAVIVDFHYAELSLRYDISTLKISPDQRGVNSVLSVNVAIKLGKFLE